MYQDKFTDALLASLRSPDIEVKARTLKAVPLRLAASEPVDEDWATYVVAKRN